MRWRSNESIQSRMSLGNAFPGGRVCWIWPLVSYLQLEHRNDCRIGWDRARVVDRHEPVACIAYLALNDARRRRRRGVRVTLGDTVLARGISEFGGRVRHHQLERVQSSRASLKLHSVLLDPPRLLYPVKNYIRISQATETISSRPSAQRICLLSH